jgi:environmental stress-induced protein Ves
MEIEAMEDAMARRGRSHYNRAGETLPVDTLPILTMRPARLIPPSEFRVMPWKNGGGRSFEIHAHPEGADFDAFEWRISLAEVAASGPFSQFPGIYRTLVLLEGNGIRLSGEGVDTVLRESYDAFDFGGERAILGTLVDGPVRDFNLMVRSDRVRGGVTIARGRRVSMVAARWTLCYAAAGPHRCLWGGAPLIELPQGHALLVDAGAEGVGITVESAAPSAVALVATVEPR